MPGRRASLANVVSWGVLALIALLIVLPVAFLVYGTFRSGGPGEMGAAFTWQNVRKVYASRTYLLPLRNTLAISFLTTLVATPFGALLAWFIARTNVPFRRWIELLIIIPIYLGPMIGALAWIALAGPRAGFINVLWFKATGATRPLVNIYSLAGVVYVMFLFFVPYAYLFVVGVLKNMDPSSDEASRMLGAGIWTTLRRITFPLIRPALFSSALLIFVFSAELFTVPTMLGSPIGLRTIPSAIYYAIEYGTGMANEAAAAGTLLFWITAGGIILYYRMVRQSRRYVTISGKGMTPRPIDLGRGRYVALAICLGYLSLAVVLPYCALVLGSFLRYVTPKLTWKLFTLGNYGILMMPDNLLAVRNSLLLAVVGASIAVAFCLLVAFTAHRATGWGAKLVDFLSMIPISIPALALAVGMLWTYLTLPLFLYGTIWILVVAYVTRFMGYGVRVFSSGLVQIDPELEEASRVAGASLHRTLLRVTIPLLRPAMLSAWTLFFIFFMGEISCTILLYTSKSITISVGIWNALGMGGSIQAFAFGMVQTTIIFLTLALAYRGGRSQAALAE